MELQPAPRWPPAAPKWRPEEGSSLSFVSGQLCRWWAQVVLHRQLGSYTNNEAPEQHSNPAGLAKKGWKSLYMVLLWGSSSRATAVRSHQSGANCSPVLPWRVFGGWSKACALSQLALTPRKAPRWICPTWLGGGYVIGSVERLCAVSAYFSSQKIIKKMGF